MNSAVRMFVLTGVSTLAACATPNGTSPGLSGSPAVTMIRLGDDMRASGDPEGAMGFYRTAAERDPADPLPLIRQGALYAALNQPLRAEQAYRAALALDAGSIDATIGRAAALVNLRQPEQALQLLQPQASTSRDPRLLRDYGVALDLTGRQPEAQAAYRRGLAIAPNDPDLHGDLALSLALAGDGSGALAELGMATAQARDWMPSDQVLVLVMAGRTAEAQAVGTRTLGDVRTAELIERTQRAGQAGTPMARALALGLVNGPEAAPEVAALPDQTAAPPAAHPEGTGSALTAHR